MTIGRFILAGAVSFMVLSGAFAQAPPSEWIKKLQSPNYGEREKAGRALEQIGADALPHLEKLLASADLETKRRAALIVERIEIRLLTDEIVRPTSLRLRVKNLPLYQALRSVEAQTGLHLGNGGVRDRVIDLDTGPLPYWQAWQRFCQTAHLTEADSSRSHAKLKPMTEAALTDLLEMLDRKDNFDLDLRFGGTPRMEFAAAPTSAQPSVDDRHSIRVGVKWLSIEPNKDGKSPRAVFAVELRAEPRLDIVSMPKVEITKIVDGAGRELTVTPIAMFPESQARLANADFLAGYVGEVQFGGLLHLRTLSWPYPIGALKELHGRVRADVAVQPRMMTVKNILKAAGTEVRGKNGITLKVLAAERNEEGNLQLSLWLDKLESLVPKTLEQQVVRVRPGVIAIRGPVDIALERLQVLDAKGMPLRQEKTQYEQAKGGKGYEVDVVFAAAGNQTDDLTLTLTDSRRTISVQLPFMVRAVAPPEKKK